MKDKVKNIFIGRQGMDELSKALFWQGIVCMILAVLLYGRLAGIPTRILFFLCFTQIIIAFIRAFSRRLYQREAENQGYLAILERQRKKRSDFKTRRSQSRDYKFFKCPGCGTIIRVPKGKGRIHINCKCGYTLYRKT